MSEEFEWECDLDLDADARRRIERSFMTKQQLREERRAKRAEVEKTLSALAAQAARQHGLLHIKQVRRAGLSRRQFLDGRSAGRWTGLEADVFLSEATRRIPRHDLLALCMQLGNGALISHTSAAELHDLPVPFGTGRHVATPGRGHSRGGIIVHERWELAPRDRTRVNGFPVTSVARTIRDSCAILSLDQGEDMLEHALNRRRTTLRDLEECLERLKRRGSDGSKRLAILLGMHGEQPPLESKPEVAFFQLLRNHGIPAPSRQADLLAGDRKRRVDFLWPEHNLVVEIDGRGYHARREAFEADAKVRTALQVQGFRVLTFTAKSVSHDQPTIVSQLRRALNLPLPAKPPPDNLRGE